MRTAIRKTTLFLLVTSILMTMFYCGTSSSSETDGVWYNGTPDSIYDYYGPVYSPDYYKLSEPVRFDRDGCPNKVVQVTPNNFITCNIANPIAVLTDDTFLFGKLGDYYFICDESLCEDNLVKYQVRIGHYEPISPTSAPENSNVTPATAPTPISPPISQATGSPISLSPADPTSPSSSPSQYTDSLISLSPADPISPSSSPSQATGSPTSLSPAPIPPSSSPSEASASPSYPRKLLFF